MNSIGHLITDVYLIAGGAASNGSSHSLLDWQNSTTEAGTGWQVPTSQNIIVDRNDKEAWPSIGGDHSETTSENDNVSVKSESVISVSSFGQESTSNSAGSSAIQVPTSSSLWSSGSTYPVSESSSWDYGIGTPSTAASTVGWSSTNTSLSKANQGPNMQGATVAHGTGENPAITTSSGWGAGTPGSLPQGPNSNLGGNKPQSAVQIPQSLASSIGNGTSAQAISQQRLISSQSSVGSQGIGAFQTSSKSPVDNWGSVGSQVSGNDAGKGNSGNNGQAQSIVGGQSMVSGWGTPTGEANKSAADKWPIRNPSTSEEWANPTTPGSQWGTQITPSRAGTAPQWPGASSALPASGQNQNPARSQPTWAQAAGKGLNTNPSNSSPNATAAASSEPNEYDKAIVNAIESHDGWGKKPVNQGSTWALETSPKLRRKGSTATNSLPEKSATVPSTPGAQGGNGNMWNNNNGTAIWESNKEPPASGQWNNNVDPNQWSGVSMKPITKDPANSWAGGQVKEPQESSQWGSKTETGSWGNSGEAGGISTWGEGQSRGSGEVDDGTAVWGNPGPNAQKPPNWNSATMTQNGQNHPPNNIGPGPKNWGESHDANWQANMAQLPPVSGKTFNTICIQLGGG
jgi:hypothetical protein